MARGNYEVETSMCLMERATEDSAIRCAIESGEGAEVYVRIPGGRELLGFIRDGEYIETITPGNRSRD